MKILANNFWKKILKHKILSAFLAVIVLGGGYYAYGKLTSTSGETRYISSAVQKGTLVVSVSGSGQVSALNQVDVKPKTSGDVIYVGVKNGDVVKSGTLLVQLDTKDAEQSVSDAQISLDQAKLNLDKMKGLVTDEGTTIRGDRKKAEDDLAKTYEDGFNTVANAFLDLQGIMSGLHDMLYSTTLGVGQWNVDYYSDAIHSALKIGYDYEAISFRNKADASYYTARTAYDANFSDYKAASRFSSVATIEKLIDQTYKTSQLVAEAVKSMNNLIQLYKDRLTENNVKPQTLADTHLSQLNTYTSKINSYLSSLLSTKTTIQNDKEAVINVGFNIADQEIRVAQVERALAEAKDALAGCSIRAPFAGTVAKVNVKRGDAVSTGSAVATIMTIQRVAKITLNEIDVAKVKVGQKSTLVFDALPDVTIAGEVIDVETLGTVSQGVVSYVVEIVFATDDDRVKPGMSVTASIATDVKTDVLLVPNSAVKLSGNSQYYVEILVGNVPQVQSVETGLSNDTMTEIKNGPKEGDLVIERTITTSAQTTATPQAGGFGGIRIPGVGGGR